MLTATHTVRYRFTCEQCGKDSGWQVYAFFKTVYSNNYKHIINCRDSERNRLLNIEAQKLIQDKLDSLKLDAKFNKYPFKDSCPHCQKHQSWGAKRVNSIAIIVLVFAILGVITSIALAKDEPEAARYMLPIYVPVLIGSIGFIVWRKKKAAKVENKQKPEVLWDDLPAVAHDTMN